MNSVHATDFSTIHVDPMTTLDETDQIGSSSRPFSTAQLAVDKAIMLMQVNGNTSFLIKIGIGHAGPVVVPEKILIGFEGVINGLSFIDKLTWYVGGTGYDAISFVRNVGLLEGVEVLDGLKPQTAFIAFENSFIARFDSSRSNAKVTLVISGISPVLGLGLGNDQRSAYVAGPGTIDIPGGSLFASNVAFNDECTLLRVGYMSANSCLFNQDIDCAGDRVELINCRWHESHQISFVENDAIVLLDASSDFDFQANHCKVINGITQTFNVPWSKQSRPFKPAFTTCGQSTYDADAQFCGARFMIDRYVIVDKLTALASKVSSRSKIVCAVYRNEPNSNLMSLVCSGSTMIDNTGRFDILFDSTSYMQPGDYCLLWGTAAGGEIALRTLASMEHDLFDGNEVPGDAIPDKFLTRLNVDSKLSGSIDLRMSSGLVKPTNYDVALQVRLSGGR